MMNLGEKMEPVADQEVRTSEMEGPQEEICLCVQLGPQVQSRAGKPQDPGEDARIFQVAGRGEVPGALRRKQRSSLWTSMLVLTTCGAAAQNRAGEGESVHRLPDGDLVRQAEWHASSGLLYRNLLAPLLPLYPTPIRPLGCHKPASSIILTPLLPKRLNQELVRR